MGSKERNLLPNRGPECPKGREEPGTSFVVTPSVIKESEGFALIVVKSASCFANRSDWKYSKDPWRKRLKRLGALSPNFMD
jgi:hypothetical protein